VLYDADGKMKRKCADCPYPEVVLHYGDGKAAYTPSLNFDTQTLQPVEERTAACRFCGRTYVTENPASTFFCEFCEKAIKSAENGSAGEAARATYKKYASMLPLSARMMAKGKYCFENEDRLLFIVGKNKFFFDKLKLKDTGLIDNPEKR
jgi:ribosomal protein L37AE/L43A